MKKDLFTLLFCICALFPVTSVNARAQISYIRSSHPASINASAETPEKGSKEKSELPKRLQELLQDDMFTRSQVGLYVYDLTADSLVFAFNEKQTMRPASNEKIVTAVTALHVLGSDYTYKTKLYLLTDEITSDFNGKIYVKGGYDPLFDNNDMLAFAQALKDTGIVNICSPIYLDNSFKDDKELGWGWCWDDKEVPLTPLLYMNKDRFASNFRQALKRVGITWNGNFEYRTVNPNARLICTRTHLIDEALIPIMKDSNNSAAESLFYQIAAAGNNGPGTRRMAVKQVQNIIRKIGLNPAHYQIADGSGLSLYNYLSPELLGKMLRFAYENNRIYTHLLPSLPIAAEDGTLERRMHKTAAAGNVQAKTGTVEGISTLSGYCTAANGNRLCFSIMNQGVRQTKIGRDFQDRVCEALCR